MAVEGGPNMMGMSGCGLIALAILAAVVIGFVLLMGRSKAGRWIVGGVLAWAALVLLGFLLVFPVRKTTVRAQHPAYSSAKAVLADTTPIWQVDLDPGFEANVYPSMTSAARALAVQVSERLSTVVPEGQSPTVVLLHGSVDRAVLEAAASGLGGRHGALKVLMESVAPKSPIERTDARAVTIIVERGNKISVRHKNSDRPWEERSGALSMQVRGRAGTFSRSVRFVDKPWVDDFGAFVSRHPTHQWLVGRSQEACTSRQEAQEQAIRTAAAKLRPYVADRLNRRTNWVLLLSGGVDMQALPGRIEAHLREGQMVTDRFTQSFARPVGDVWREAVLVDVSRRNIDRLVGRVTVEATSQRTSLLQTVLSIGGLVVVLGLVYAFLNAATKGYYAWAIRVAVAVLLVAGVLLLLTVG